MKMDIVAFLREWAVDIRRHSGASIDAERLEEAADEIERLREYLRLRGEDIIALGQEIGNLNRELDRRDADPSASI